VFERTSAWFGRAQRQTLEPRLLYVNTRSATRAGLPNFDAGGADFNFASIYSDNAFSGIDRVSDAHQITAGVTTRLVDAATGAEPCAWALVQRYLLRDQRITPARRAMAGPLQRRLSDVLLEGSTSGCRATGASTPRCNTAPTSARGAHHRHGALPPGPFRTLGGHLPLHARPVRAARAGLAVAAVARRRGETAGGRAPAAAAAPGTAVGASTTACATAA
jgi:LPS-assembly protein